MTLKQLKLLLRDFDDDLPVFIGLPPCGEPVELLRVRQCVRIPYEPFCVVLLETPVVGDVT